MIPIVSSLFSTFIDWEKKLPSTTFDVNIEQVIAFCLTSMVASAPSDVRPIVDKVEARHIEAIVKPANGAWGYFK